MLDHRRNEERRESGRDGLVAVAVDKDKFSKYALKWAAEHLLRRNQTVKLIHVLHRSGGNDEELIQQHPDNQTMDVFLPFRCFCTRRNLQCELVVLQHQNVARALIEYVSNHAVKTLLLGSPSKNGLTRLFKATDIPSTVMKWAPDFCNVYIVSKGKCHAARSATRPFPPILAGEVPHPQILPTNISNEEVTIACDEFSAPERGDSYINSGRPSTDSTFFAFYENLGMNPSRNSASSRAPHNSLSEIPSGSFDSERASDSSQNTDDTDEEIKRLKMELKQTVEMYHTLYKETLAAKDKAIQLEQWKMKEEKRLQELLLAEERDQAKYKAAIEASEAAQKILKLEIQHRVKAEIRSLREAEEKTKEAGTLNPKNSQLVEMIRTMVAQVVQQNVVELRNQQPTLQNLDQPRLTDIADRSEFSW
ncbi:U-box domain-containing protein 35-like [Pistacia vera]|uniref:U-box domain-containing protein 35-like n=1 Tax=Pistacia vera TaxID=55513 RepID=UPI001262D529|nr:U-box domain-containing protein 35-like [Pistacia vera]